MAGTGMNRSLLLVVFGLTTGVELFPPQVAAAFVSRALLSWWFSESSPCCPYPLSTYAAQWMPNEPRSRPTTSEYSLLAKLSKGADVQDQTLLPQCVAVVGSCVWHR